MTLPAGEGEYVAFAEECSCDGPVESWLQNVVDSMRAALSHEFKVAIPAYDEKPRIKWIFDYSVQNTIMVSRTFFTQDVNEAFEELEEGNEDALKVSLLINLYSSRTLTAYKSAAWCFGKYQTPASQRMQAIPYCCILTLC